MTNVPINCAWNIVCKSEIIERFVALKYWGYVDR